MKKIIALVVFGSFLVGITVTLALSQERNKQTSAKEDSPTIMQFTNVIPHKSKTELYGESDVIVQGVVEKVLPGKWSNPDFKRGAEIRNIVQTDAVIKINSVYKGTIESKELVVRINKGTVDDTIVYSDSDPDFKIDEKVLLFLAKDVSDVRVPEEDYYVVSGLIQGKFNLDDNDPSQTVYKNIPGYVVDTKNIEKELVEEVKNYEPIRLEKEKVYKDMEEHPENYGL